MLELSTNVLKFLKDKLGSELGVIPLAGDASSRKYFRIVAGEKSYVLMVWEPFGDPKDYPFLDVLNHFARSGVRVPHVETFSSELGVVLLEDLGDLTLERKFWENQNQKPAMDFYAQANDQLIRIHYFASRETRPPSVCQTTQFDTAKFMWEMNYARQHLLEGLNHIHLSPKSASALQSEFLDICETLHAEPKYVCHRDYHSRNLMIKFGQVSVIDFQDARTGPIQYDLVSLIHDSYVDLSPESRDFVLENYRTKAREHLPKDYDWNHFDRIFSLQTIQRCFKACGSFSSFFNTRQDTRYLKYIHKTVNLVASTLDSAKYPVFSDVLKSEGILEKRFELT